MGQRCSTPAPMMWIHLSLGATARRFSVGRSQQSNTSLSFMELSKLSQSQSMKTSRCGARSGCRARAASQRSRVVVKTGSLSGVEGKVSGEA
jgi:hypothetical protein